jgi:site-specific recombinase XerD
VERVPEWRVVPSSSMFVWTRLAQGVHPKAVQSMLGHSQISLTMDTYSTLLPSVSRDAADQMEQVLRA